MTTPKDTATESLSAQAATTTSRRGFVKGCAGAAAVIALGGVKFLPSKSLVRPPGAQDDDFFFAGCIHCQRCIEVCPQNAISIAHLEDGVLQMRTPKMDFKAGWCNFCEGVDGGPACVAVCPTHCIQPFSEPTVDIGIAQLTKEWCLAYRGMGCHSCLDACKYDAITLDESHVPVVNEDLCNGCGACEYSCISLSAGSLSGTWDGSEATDRAIVVKPLGSRTATA